MLDLRPSVYTLVSKEIGFKLQPVELPQDWTQTIEITTRAKAGDRTAFKQLFMIWRFYPSPRRTKEYKIFETCLTAFLETEEMFRNMYHD